MCAKKVHTDRVVYRRPWVRLETEVTVGDRGREPGQQTAAKSPQDHEMHAETALSVRRDDMTWKEWFLKDFLRYWYWVGALSLVAFLLMQVSWMYHVRDTAGLSVLALVGILLIVLEFYMYKVVWPEGVFTEGWPAGRRLRKAVRRLRWRL